MYINRISHVSSGHSRSKNFVVVNSFVIYIGEIIPIQISSHPLATWIYTWYLPIMYGSTYIPSCFLLHFYSLLSFLSFTNCSKLRACLFYAYLIWIHYNGTSDENQFNASVIYCYEKFNAKVNLFLLVEILIFLYSFVDLCVTR